MEQELMAEGVPAGEIMGMCDLHSQVVRDILVEKASAPPPPGHRVDTSRRENEALRAQMASLRAALQALAPAGAHDESAIEPARLLDCRRTSSGLMDVEKHYKEEHILLPMALQNLTETEWGEPVAAHRRDPSSGPDPVGSRRARG